ncbi:MAG: hypothetical protein SF028_07730 [Candidatus Sumerlaeia bacterium]|nr:hypothetical protein [Candidatus Sumerlaeia bacterium]
MKNVVPFICRAVCVAALAAVASTAPAADLSGPLLFDQGNPAISTGSEVAWRLDGFSMSDDFAFGQESTISALRFWAVEGAGAWDGTGEITVWANDGTLPTAEVATRQIANVDRIGIGPWPLDDNFDFYTWEVDLASPLTLPAGIYSLEIDLGIGCDLPALFWVTSNGPVYGNGRTLAASCGVPTNLRSEQLAFQLFGEPTGGGADDGGSVFIDSQFSQDAILYEGATPGVGSTVLIAGRRTQVGDNVNNRAERGLLGFATAIPGAAARTAQLRLTVDGKTGNVSGLGDLEIYYADPFYGTTAGWQASDFQAAPTSGTPVATIPNSALVDAAVGDALWVSIDPTLVPLSGNVQFRLQFANGTDGNATADNIKFGAGGQSSSNRHERSDLVVEFDLATTNGCGTNPSTGGAPLVLDPLYSLPGPDGSVIEYTANAGVGLLTDNANAVAEFGDLPSNQQVKALLAFDTSVLTSYGTPQVTSASLCLTRESFAGDPSTLGRVYVEMVCPNQAAFFGPSAGLDREDFEAYAWITDATAEEPVLPRANGDTVCWPLSPEALAALNRLRPTQFRLSFENADSDNATKDTFRFYTGNVSGANRARLDIEIAQ